MDRIESKAERPDKPVGSGRTASRFDLVLDTVGRLLRRGAIGNLERMVSKMHPADVAKMLHHLNTAQEKRTVFELIKPDTSKATALSETYERDIGDALQELPAADIAMLLKDLPDDDQAYVLTCLPEERSQEVLKLMKPEDSAEVEDLLRYEPKSAGAMMTTEYFSLTEDTTAEEANRKLQGAKDTGNVFYVYVTDSGEKLVGVLSLRQLLQVPPHTRLGTMLKRQVIGVSTDTDQEVVALVTFIPVIAAMGGNVGLQSSTMVIRGLATCRIELSDVKRVFAREVLIGFIIGLLCGAVTLSVAAVMHINLHLGMVVGIAMVCALVMSTSMATIMPVVLKRYGVDRAVAAGPFVTTANDITGITIYLRRATTFLSYLK